MFDELTALKNIREALMHADEMVKAYIAGIGNETKAGSLAVDALRHPMMGFLGLIEGRIFDIDPDALDNEEEEDE